MSKREILAGATDQTIDIFVNSSAVTTGAGLTGLVFNTTSLTCYYRKGATGTPTALTLATQTVGGAHSDGGFVAVDGTNCPGQYRLDLSDTIVATAGMVTLYLHGAANMVPCVIEIEVVSINKFDAVRMGLTALPNANAGAAGGLPTDSAGKTSFNDIAATAVVSSGAITTSGGAVSTVTTATNVTTVNGLAANVITAASIAADAITDAKVASDVTIASVTGAVGSVTAGVTVTTNNDKTGYGLSAAAVQAIWDALTSALTTVGSIGKLLVDNINATISSRSTVAATDIVSSGAITTSGGAVSTVTTVTTATNLTNAPTSGDLTATMKASVNTEVLDVLNTDTFAEPGQGTPAATASLVAKIGYLYKMFRNRKTQTSTVWSLYNDDAVTVDQKATVADDGTTASKTEIATGP